MSDKKSSSKKGDIARLILGTIGMAGILVAGIVAPGIFKILPNRKRYSYSKKSLDRSLENLKNRGLIKFVPGRISWRVELTERGQAEFFAYEMKEKILKPPKHWNGEWHLLVFDIEETRKKVRDNVRHALVNLGFIRLQDSVWVFPYPCEEVLELLRTKYGVRHEALYVCARKIAKDKWLRKHFDLPLS